MTSSATKSEGQGWIVYRELMSAVGAFSLLNMVKDLVELKSVLREALNAWAAIVHPVSEFLFGWILVRLPITPPNWIHDYLVLGIVLTSAAYRGLLDASDAGDRSVSRNSIILPFMLLWFPLWPISIALVSGYALYLFVARGDAFKLHRYFITILRLFLYFVGLLLVNYLLFLTP